jgi:hypothetical protein
MGRQSPVAVEGHHPKEPTKVQRGVLKAIRGGQSVTQRVIVTTSCDEGDNDMEADDSDEELIATVKHELKHQPW